MHAADTPPPEPTPGPGTPRAPTRPFPRWPVPVLAASVLVWVVVALTNRLLTLLPFTLIASIVAVLALGRWAALRPRTQLIPWALIALFADALLQYQGGYSGRGPLPTIILLLPFVFATLVAGLIKDTGLGAGTRAQRTFARATYAALVLATVAYLGGGLPLMFEAGFHRYVERTAGVEPVRVWALRFLQEHENDELKGGRRPAWYHRECRPLLGSLARLDPGSIVVHNRGDGQPYVWIGFGSGFFHWAIIVGRPGFRYDGLPRVSRWGDGVYMYQGS